MTRAAVRDRPRERGLDAGAGEVAGDQLGAVAVRAAQDAAFLRDDLGQVDRGAARRRPAAFHRAGRAPVEARPQRHDGHVVVAAARLRRARRRPGTWPKLAVLVVEPG